MAIIYKHKPPELKNEVVEVEALDEAMDELRANSLTYEPLDRQVKDAFGLASWASVHMPRWLISEPYSRQVFERPKIRINYEPQVTWMRRGETPPMARTDQLEEMPPCMEIRANAAIWDPIWRSLG